MNHVPVLAAEALSYLSIDPDGIYVDCTYGAGGHSAMILQALKTGRLIAFDVDPAAHERPATDSRLTLVRTNFRHLSTVLDDLEIEQIDGVLYDLGVSSMQFDQAQRGFSFREDARIDMRMDQSSGPSAYDILLSASEKELADIFFRYGGERGARRIARAIVQRRSSGRLPGTTQEFARMVSGIVQRRGHRERTHPATKTFQGLRIAVNDELNAFSESLQAAVGRLRSAGRAVVISFHSLEDRIAKVTFREDERLRVLTRKAVVPSEAEIGGNPRARSAKLRAAERLEERAS